MLTTVQMALRRYQFWKVLGELNLRLLRQHNLSNSLAAFSCRSSIEFRFSVIANSIANIEGHVAALSCAAKLIFFSLMTMPITQRDPRYISRCTFTARPEQRVVAIFQPHRYSRTLTFLPEFAQSFSDADLVVISDIYSRRTELGTN